MNYISELNKSRSTLTILQFLNTECEVKVTGLIGKTAGQRGVYSALEALLKFGLVTDKKGAEFPHPRLFTLTESGKKVAECLNQIEKIIDHSIVIMRQK
jgi:hypothetical protein